MAGAGSSRAAGYSYASSSARPSDTTDVWAGNTSLGLDNDGSGSGPTPPAVTAMIGIICVAAAMTNGCLVLASCLSRAWREHVPAALLYMFCVGFVQGCAQLTYTMIGFVENLSGAPCAFTHALSALTTYAGVAALPTAAIARAVRVRWPHATDSASRCGLAVALCAQLGGALGLALPPALGVYRSDPVSTLCGGAVVYSFGALLALLGWTAASVAVTIGTYGWLLWVAMSRSRRRRLRPGAASTTAATQQQPQQKKSDGGDSGGMSRVARRGTINMVVTSALYVCLMVPFAATLPLSQVCQGGRLSPNVSCAALRSVSGAAGALFELSLVVNPLVYTLLTPQLRALARAACCRHRCRGGGVAALQSQSNSSERSTA